MARAAAARQRAARLVRAGFSRLPERREREFTKIFTDADDARDLADRRRRRRSARSTPSIPPRSIRTTRTRGATRIARVQTGRWSGKWRSEE